jgi:hypothetical protein
MLTMTAAVTLAQLLPADSSSLLYPLHLLASLSEQGQIHNQNLRDDDAARKKKDDDDDAKEIKQLNAGYTVYSVLSR